MSERRKKRLPASEISAFCEQMALLLNGGIPIDEAIYILYQEKEQNEFKKVLKEINQHIKDHIPFYEALSKSGVFPQYMTRMVKIGEASGKLKEVMASLAAYYEREQNIKESVKNVIFYPLVLLLMIGVILLVLVVKIQPMFQAVFYNLDNSISKTSEDMMYISMLIGRIVGITVTVLFLVILIMGVLNLSNKGNYILKKMGQRLPYIKKIQYKLGIGKFISAMSLMVGSGITNEDSLEMASELVDQPTVKKQIIHCLRSIRNNGTLEDSLRDSKLITGINGRMISVGVKTGVLDVAFEKLSSRYDEEINESLEETQAAVETALVLCLSTIVGLVLISVMLPLISIISSIC